MTHLRLTTACTLLVATWLSASGAHAAPRTLDGTGNNVANPDWGSSHEHLIRMSANAYADGISAPRAGSAPNARLISNTISAQAAGTPNSRNLSGFVWQWGQFIDHDIGLTEAATPAEAFHIPVPSGDAWFDPMSTGTQVIGLSRSDYDPATGTGTGNPPEERNAITAYLDGSMVYGSDSTTAASLRAGSNGLLAVTTSSHGDLLPTAGGMFVAGDVRAMEQVGLTSMHTLFVREHNRVATELRNAGFSLVDEALYQAARKVVGAQIQQITYTEFLPALLGQSAFDARIGRWDGYEDTVNAGIRSEFSTAAYRIGHTMLPSELWRTDAGLVLGTAPLQLRDAFFDPSHIMAAGIDPFLGGLARQHAQEIDGLLVDEVRNFLFGPPGAGGFDLAALNIQRGRDHGLGTYNDVRAALGLPLASTFAEITSDIGMQAALDTVYGSVADVDLWVGGLLEDHLAGGSVGETFARIIADQFRWLRDGDRFWFENDAELAALDAFGFGLDHINSLRLADVLRANTGLAIAADANLFFVQPVPAPAGLAVAWLALVAIACSRRAAASRLHHNR